MSGTENLFRRFLSLVSAKMVATVLAVLSTPIIVRLLGPGGYGDYAVMLSIFSLYMIPISAMITEGVQKFVGESRPEPNWPERVVAFYLLLATGVVLVGATLLMIVTVLDLPALLFGDRFVLYFYLLVVFVVVSQFRALTYHTVLGFGLERFSGPLSVARKFTTVTLGIALLLAGYGVAGMLVGHVAANLFVAIAAGFIVVRRLSVSGIVDGIGGLPYRELMSFNVYNVGLVLFSMSLYHVDIVMLRSIAGSQSTGFYKAALSLAEYLWFVPIVVQRLLLHSTAKLWTEDRTADITQLAGRVTRYIVLLVVLLAIGLAILAHRVVPLYYGEPFVVSITPLLVLLPGAVGFAAARPLKAITQGSGRVKVLLAAIGAAAGINLVLNALLIPLYGMLGAAVATSIGYGSMFALLLISAWHVGYDPLDDFRGVRIAVTGLCTAVPLVALDRFLGPDLLALVVVPPVGALVFGGFAFATGALDAGEVQEILGRLPEPFGSAVSNQSWLDR